MSLVKLVNLWPCMFFLSYCILSSVGMSWYMSRYHELCVLDLDVLIMKIMVKTYYSYHVYWKQYWFRGSRKAGSEHQGAPQELKQNPKRPELEAVTASCSPGWWDVGIAIVQEPISFNDRGRPQIIITVTFIFSSPLPFWYLTTFGWPQHFAWRKSAKTLRRFKWDHWGNIMFKDQETENARSLGGGSNPLHFSWKTGLQDHQLTFSMHHPATLQ
jgi:hypothetical protein